MPYFQRYDDAFDWRSLLNGLSNDFSNEIQNLTAMLNSAFPHIDDDMGSLISLVPAPDQLSAPFTGQAATAYHQHSQVLLHATGFRIGGDQMAALLGTEYEQQAEQQSSDSDSFHSHYQVGYTRGENGILKMFADRLERLVPIVTQPVSDCINNIQVVRDYPPIVPVQSAEGSSMPYPVYIDDEVIYGIVQAMYGNRAPIHVIDMMLRFGPGVLNDSGAKDYYSAYIQNDNNIGVSPVASPSVPDRQTLAEEWREQCANVVQSIDHICQEVHDAYRKWSVEFDENVNAYYAWRERTFKQLFMDWHLSQAQLAGKDENQTVANTVDGLGPNGSRTPIGISMGMLDNGQTCVVVNLAGTEFDNTFGPNGPTGDVSEAVLHTSTYHDDVYYDIEQYIIEHNLPRNTPIIINGHSLGGIVAQSLTQDYNAKTFNLVEVQTYGSPDMGDKPNPHTRLSMYYNQNDPVPNVWGQSGRILHTQPSQREHLVSMSKNSQGNYPTGFDAHGNYRSSPDLVAGGKYGSVDYVITGNTEYYTV